MRSMRDIRDTPGGAEDVTMIEFPWNTDESSWAADESLERTVAGEPIVNGRTEAMNRRPPEETER